jgi:hypothetical protein
MHVHVTCADGEAKFWLEPTVSLADYSDLKQPELRRLQIVVEDRKNEIIASWKKHFGR